MDTKIIIRLMIVSLITAPARGMQQRVSSAASELRTQAKAHPYLASAGVVGTALGIAGGVKYLWLKKKSTAKDSVNEDFLGVPTATSVAASLTALPDKPAHAVPASTQAESKRSAAAAQVQNGGQSGQLNVGPTGTLKSNGSSIEPLSPLSSLGGPSNASTARAKGTAKPNLHVDVASRAATLDGGPQTRVDDPAKVLASAQSEDQSDKDKVLAFLAQAQKGGRPGKVVMDDADEEQEAEQQAAQASPQANGNSNGISHGNLNEPRIAVLEERLSGLEELLMHTEYGRKAAAALEKHKAAAERLTSVSRPVKSDADQKRDHASNSPRHPLTLLQQQGYEQGLLRQMAGIRIQIDTLRHQTGADVAEIRASQNAVIGEFEALLNKLEKNEKDLADMFKFCQSLNGLKKDKQYALLKAQADIALILKHLGLLKDESQDDGKASAPARGPGKGLLGLVSREEPIAQPVPVIDPAASARNAAPADEAPAPQANDHEQAPMEEPVGVAALLVSAPQENQIPAASQQASVELD